MEIQKEFTQKLIDCAKRYPLGTQININGNWGYVQGYCMSLAKTDSLNYVSVICATQTSSISILEPNLIKYVLDEENKNAAEQA